MIKPLTLLGGIAAALATCGALPASTAGATPASASSAPARMLVYSQEWSLWPSRTSLPAGAVVVQLWNRGQDAHDLRIRRLHRGRMTGATQEVSKTQSGALNHATWHLAPGHYELYCSMPDHLKRGMHTTLTVK
jgi:plastocyanin